MTLKALENERCDRKKRSHAYLKVKEQNIKFRLQEKIQKQKVLKTQQNLMLKHIKRM